MTHLHLFKSFFLALIAAMLPQLANAYDFKVDELCYNYNEDGTSVTVTFEKKNYYGFGDGYYSLSGDLVIPETVSYNGRTYSVTTIDEFAFDDCTGLTSVTIPNSVTSIDYCAFYKCTGLTSMVVESGNIKYDSRNNCNAIIETATNALFIGCKNTVIPNSVTTIGDEAFNGCSGLTSVTIPNSVTSIGGGAFRDCTGLTSVTIGNSVTTIGTQAFEDCSGLTSVTIGNSVTTIGDYAFQRCTGLTSLTIPNSVSTIGYMAFYDCFGLTSLTIPNSVTTIDYCAFVGCGLTSVTLTGNGPWLPKNYMPSISQINTLNIGSGITSLGNFDFSPDVVNCYAEIPPSCSSGTFSNYDGALHVPSTSAVAYFTAPYWQIFNNLSNDLTGKVTMSQNTANLVIGSSITLEATTIPSGANVVWLSSNPSVATVNDEGVVTAAAAGECDIIATLETNPAVYAICHITTSYPEITLSLSDESLEMNVGNEQTLTVTITPDNTGLTPTWSSSNTSIAIVDENGKVTAIGEGECDIIATVLDKTATCHVNVTNNVTITLNLDNSIMGASQILTVYPSCSPDVPVELVVTSSDPSVAMARVVNRTNAPALGLKSFPEKGMAISMMEELADPSESKDPALASTKAIMIVGAQNGTATITVTTADGKAVPAVLELRVVDVNSDNVVTAADVTALYKYILNGDLTYYDTSDINGDGNITAADITAVYKLLLGN
jgi:uncharacterized protein YjdB